MENTQEIYVGKSNAEFLSMVTVNFNRPKMENRRTMQTSTLNKSFSIPFVKAEIITIMVMVIQKNKYYSWST